jgi:uncharacterized SAM-binding protein YcdF (DUF218 family)
MMGYSARPGGRGNAQRGGIISRFLFLIVFLALLFVLFLVRYPILRLAGNFWIVEDPPQPSDAIVMLGDDNYNGDRAARAAELFKAGWAPRVIASGRYLRPYASIAELEAHDLSDRGVPQSAIVRFAHQATDTRDECADIGQLISQHGWKRILLVTSSYHTRRSRYICERVLPAGTVLRMGSARDSDYDPDNWWRTRTGVKVFFHESVGIIVAMWELRHSDVQTTESAAMNLPQVPLAVLSPRLGPFGLHPGRVCTIVRRICAPAIGRTDTGNLAVEVFHVE